MESDSMNRNERKYLLRQVHICSGVWVMFYMSGLCAGSTTVIIPQLQQAGDTVDDELASWLYSAPNITAIPWVFILPSLTQYTGRKLTYILTCVCTSIVHIILYLSKNPYEILVASIIQGFANASNLTVIMLFLCEYSTSKHRGILTSINTASLYWGIWTSNAIGTYFHFKWIAVLGIVCSAYTFTIVFYPESPMWLVSKGKYKKAEDSFKSLHGNFDSKELQDFIHLHRIDSMKKTRELKLSTIKSKEFYMPLLLCILILEQHYFSGKYVSSIYALEVIGRMTDSKEAANTGMLILDGATILGMFLGSILSKFFKRRTHFYFTSFLGVVFLFIISLYLYLVRLSVFYESTVLTIVLLVAYSLSISCGCMVLGLSLYTELLSLRYQRIMYMILSLFMFVTTATMLKFIPMAFMYFGIDGMFLFYAITFGVLTIILYVYLPDTQGKSKVEIEELFKNTKESEIQNASHIKEKKHLIMNN